MSHQQTSQVDWTRLPPDQLRKLEMMTRALRNPSEFVFGHIYTYDEVDPALPEKPFPRLEYLQRLIDAWIVEPRLCVVKSRRMIVTWLFLALDLWLAMTQPHAAVYVVSTEQAKSDKLLKRVEFIYNHLDPARIIKPAMVIHRGKEGDPTRIDFPELQSVIKALSSEPDALRQEGASLLHVEELAFVDNAEVAWKAMIPTVLGGGRMVVISSAQDGTLFKRLVFDDLSTNIGTSSV